MTSATTRKVILSPTVRLAVRTGLAMVLAFGVALANDWPKPVWAGFAIVVLSLDTTGEFVNKALLRMAGTVLAAVVALGLIALFPQERWWFIGGLALWEGICAYQIPRSRHPYFWYIAGFVTATIAISGGPPNGQTDFLTAMERLQETTLGILAYTLSAFVVPLGQALAPFRLSWEKMLTDLSTLTDMLHQASSLEQERELVSRIRTEGLQSENLLLPACQESPRMFQQRQRWRCTLELQPRLLVAIQRAGSCLHALSFSERQRLEPILGKLLKQVQHRLNTIRSRSVQASGKYSLDVDHSLEGIETDSPESPAVPVRDAWSSLLDGHVAHGARHRANLGISLESLQHLDRLSLDFLKCWDADLLPRAHRAMRWGLDPDALLGAFQISLMVLMGGLLWIFVPDLPDGPFILVLIASFGMALVRVPGARAGMVFLPALVAILIAALVYVIVLPHLHTFAQLATVLFLITLGYTLLFTRATLARVLGIDVMLVILGVSNVQTYDFISLLNTTIVVLLALGIIALAQEVPFSSLPEKNFVRLLNRFLWHSEALIRRAISSEAANVLSGRSAPIASFRLRDLARLPARMAAAARRLDCVSMGCDRSQINAILDAVQEMEVWLQAMYQGDMLGSSIPVPIHPFAPNAQLEDREGCWPRLIRCQRTAAELAAAALALLEDPTHDQTQGLLFPEGGLIWAGCNLRLQDALQQLSSAMDEVSWERWFEPRFSLFT